MALAYHYETALAVNDSEGTDGGNTVGGAVVTAFSPGGDVAMLYDDESGTNGSTAKQTKTSGTEVGTVEFWIEEGIYDIYMNGVYKRRVIVNREGITGVIKSYATTAEIEALEPTVTGTVIENQERANAKYVLAASGYTALPGDLTSANGRVWELQIDGKANVLWFGAVADFDGTTGTDNYDAFTDAKDRASHVFVPEGWYGYSRALKFDKFGFVWECESPDTIMRCTGESGELSRFPEDSCVLLGTYRDGNLTVQASYALETIELGSEVTLSDASDASNFNVGDVVYLRSVAYMTSGTTDIPRNGQLLEVKSVQGAVIEFYGCVDFVEDSLLVNLTSGTTNYLLSNNYDTGLKNFASKNVAILGGTWETPNSDSAFCGGGGALNCVVDIHATRCRNGVAYGNLYCGCDFSVLFEEFEKSPAEFAFNSRNNSLRVGNSRKINDEESPYPIWINSSSVGNSINIGTLIVPYAIDDYAVRISNSSENDISIGRIVGDSAGLSVVHMSDSNNAGDRHETSNNTVKIGYSDVDAPNCAHFESNGLEKSNTITINSYGAHDRAVFFNGSENSVVSDSMISSGVISQLNSPFGCSVENSYIAEGINTSTGLETGGIQLSNVRTDMSNKLKNTDVVFYPSTATNAVPFSKSSTISAGAFGELDRIDVSMASFIPGTSGSDTKTYTLSIGGSTSINYQTSGAGADIQISAQISYATNSAVIVSYSVVSNGSVVASDVDTVSGLDLSGTDEDITITVTTDGTTDSLFIRDCRIKAYSANAGQF